MFSEMKRSHTYVIMFFSAVILLGLLAIKPVMLLFEQDSCLESGGKWAANQEICIYKNCAETSSCLPSYGNNVLCKSLSIGISSEELYFQLGMPESQIGNTYTFAGGGGGTKITARIEAGKVANLICGAQ